MKFTVGKPQSKPKKKKKGRSIKDRAERSAKDGGDVEVYLPSPKWAEKRIEEEGTSIWSPPVGKTRFVMLPSLEQGRVSPWVETRGHYIGGNDALKLMGLAERPSDLPLVVACSKFHGNKKCELCELMGQLKKSRSKKERELGDSLFASLQCYANIVVKGKSKAVRVYRFGWRVAQPFLSALEDGNIFCDPKRANLLKIRREGQGMATQYTASVTSETVSFRKKWLDLAGDLAQYQHPMYSREEMRECIDVLMSNVKASSAGMDYSSDFKESDLPF